MEKFQSIKNKYLALGLREDNIDFAISSVVDGISRTAIIETLTADYRGMTESQCNDLLNDLFATNGGEFKKENQGGYLYGILLTALGLGGAGFLIGMITYDEWSPKLLVLSGAAAVFGLLKGPALLVKAFRGKFRDADDPFSKV